MNVTIDDFEKLDIRIGTIIKAEIPKWSHWVMKLTVDMGGSDPSTLSLRSGRQNNTIIVFAGIMHHYKPQELEGKQSLFIVNLEPKKIGPEGDFSQGMMLMGIGKLKKPIIVGEEKIEEEPVLLIPSKKVPNGTKIM